MPSFTLSFDGNEADNHQLDFYDAAQAMIGFQRSLAITTHLILNGEVITQAPSLKNAQILSTPPQNGSWEIVATIIGAAFALGTASRETPIGHLIHSAYDYVICETLGFHIDYSQTIGQQYERIRVADDDALPILEQSQFDSVIEKCEYAVREMHRPIIKSETATSAKILTQANGRVAHLSCPLNTETYGYVSYTEEGTTIETIIGMVSSYNINTFKGRMFVPEERRPIPFELANSARDVASVEKIMQSMTMNARDRFANSNNNGQVNCSVLKNLSRTGRLKSYFILEVL